MPLTPPDQQQFSLFLPTQNLIAKFYALFMLVANLQKGVIVNQIANDPVSGTMVEAKQSDENLWVEIVLAAGIAALDIKLPAFAIPRDGQRVLITSTHIITTPFFIATGSAIVGSPATLGPSAPVEFLYSKSSNTWYKQ